MMTATRINWKRDIDLSNVHRDMTPQEMKDALLKTPANRPYLFDLQKITPIYARKAISLTKGWYRRPRRYGRKPARAPQVAPRNAGTVTFIIGGCKITVARGTSVEVLNG